MTSIACIVITYNRDDFIESCIESLLRERSEALDVRVVVINNGSEDNTAEILARYDADDVTVVTNPVNKSLCAALNMSLDIGHTSDADYFLLLNDDIEMKPGAIAEMVHVCREVPNAIVSPLQINYRKPDELDATMMERLQASTDLITDVAMKGEVKRYYHQKSLIGSALLAHRNTYSAIGNFDPAFSFYGLDDDYCNRARDMGIPLLVAMKAKMLHMHGRVSDTKTVCKDAWLRRWTTMYHARVIFTLKSTERSLPGNYLRAAGGMLSDIFRFMLKRFPKGTQIASRTLIDVLRNYPRIKERRALEQALLMQHRSRQ